MPRGGGEEGLHFHRVSAPVATRARWSASCGVSWVEVEGLAGELGFEPRLTESESAVLPLNYSPTGLAGSRLEGGSRAVRRPLT